jgi:hypothetical protein
VSCSKHSNDPTKAKQVKVLEVGVDAKGNGTCLLIPEDLPPEIKKLPVIGCDQPHTHEVYAKIAYFDEAAPTKPVDVFPGLTKLDTFAQTQCLKAFTDYVGINLFDSRLNDTWLLPTLDAWNKQNYRSILCVVLDPANEKVVGSLRGSKQ